MNIFSERLNVRLIDISHLEEIHELHSRPEVDEYNILGIPENLQETENVIADWISENQRAEIQNYTFAIKRIQDKKFIGLIALKLGNRKYEKAEVWYKLSPDYWGLGYASEALEIILEFGFNKLKLHRIEAGCAVDNRSSIKLLEKAGMRLEGRKRLVLPLKSGWSDNFMYAILEEDFNKNKE